MSRSGATSAACLFLAAICGGPAVAESQAAPTAAQREIQPLLDDELLAANAHDTDRFLTAYLHDSTLVVIFNGNVTRGFAAVREQQLKAWNNGTSDVVYALRSPTEYRALSPTIALATMLLTSHRTLPTGEARTADLTVSTVWEKRHEGWRAIQIYESVVR